MASYDAFDIEASPQTIVGLSPALGVEINATYTTPPGVGSLEVESPYDVVAQFDGLPTSATPLARDLDNGHIPVVFSGTVDDTGITCGVHQVTVTALLTNSTDTVSSSDEVDVVCPSITLDPAVTYSAGVDTVITVNPSGYLNSTEVLAGSGVSAPVVLFDGQTVGNYDATKPITFEESAACGVHIVTLTRTVTGRLARELSNPVLSARATYTVACPAASLDPSTISRVQEPVQIAVTGSTFHPKTPISISLDGTQVAAATTDATGEATTPITVDGLACGKYDVTVAETAGDSPASAQATLTISCDAVLDLKPAVATLGTTVHVTGFGFAPGATVTLRWKLRDGAYAPVTGSPKTAAGDAGAIDFWTVVLSGFAPGTRTLVASDGQSSGHAQVLIVPGPLEPGQDGQFLSRN